MEGGSLQGEGLWGFQRDETMRYQESWRLRTRGGELSVGRYAWGCVRMCGELLGGASATFAASARPAAHAKDDVSVPRQHSQDLHAKLGVKYGRTPAWLFRLCCSRRSCCHPADSPAFPPARSSRPPYPSQKLLPTTLISLNVDNN
jgi:hypothetical protein